VSFPGKILKQNKFSGTEGRINREKSAELQGFENWIEFFIVFTSDSPFRMLIALTCWWPVPDAHPVVAA
jgi:hypothetical protein